MTRNPLRSLMAACLGLALATPAFAATDRSEMELALVRQGDQVVAAVLLSHRYDLPLFLDLTYTVNGQRVKLEPVEVFGPSMFTQTLGPPDVFYSVCASFEGIVAGSPGESSYTSGMTCDVRFADTGNTPPRESLIRRAGDPRLPDRSGLLPSAPIAPDFKPMTRR